MAKRRKKQLKKLPNRVTWLIPTLRNKSRQWPGKKWARDKVKVKMAIGTFKNGKTQYKTMYQCASCEELFDRKDTQMDHIAPVVPPEQGVTDLNTYVERLLADPEGYQCLCKPCHAEKTKAENKKRKRKKRAKKVDKEDKE